MLNITFVYWIIVQEWEEYLIVRMAFNPFIPEFLKWTLPSLNWTHPLMQIGLSAKIQNGKKSRYYWEGSLPTMFAKVYLFVCRVERVNRLIITYTVAYWCYVTCFPLTETGTENCRNHHHCHCKISYKPEPKIANIHVFMWAVPCKNVSSGIYGQWRVRSTCVSVQSNQDLHYLLTESLYTAECMSGEQKPEWYFVHVHDDLNLHILCMFEGTFSHGVAHLIAHITRQFWFCPETTLC